MPTFPWVGMECRSGVVVEPEERKCMLCISVDEMCTLNSEPAMFQEPFKKGGGVMRLKWSPLYPHPPLPPSFLAEGADLLGLPSHPSEPAPLAALTPETTPAPGASKCFQVALTLPIGEEPPCPGSIDVVNYTSNSLKSISHRMMFGQTDFYSFCANGKVKIRASCKSKICSHAVDVT